MKKFWMVANCSVGQKAANNLPAIVIIAYFATKQEAIDDMKRHAGSSQKAGRQHEWYVLEAVTTAQIPVPDIAVTDLKD